LSGVHPPEWEILASVLLSRTDVQERERIVFVLAKCIIGKGLHGRRDTGGQTRHRAETTCQKRSEECGWGWPEKIPRNRARAYKARQVEAPPSEGVASGRGAGLGSSLHPGSRCCGSPAAGGSCWLSGWASLPPPALSLPSPSA